MVKKEGDYFILATKSSSYIFRILDTGHPDHVHYGRRIDDRNSFADMGRTIIENFKLEKKDFQIGSIIDELLKD